MSRTPPGTVKETGAQPGHFLIGIDEEPLNRGLRVKVHQAQEPKGGPIEGGFDLFAAGTGTYSSHIARHVGASFRSAAALIELVKQAGGDASKCKNILNRNKLREAPMPKFVIEREIPGAGR